LPKLLVLLAQGFELVAQLPKLLARGRPGRVARAAPDGCTLSFGQNNSHVMIGAAREFMKITATAKFKSSH
jgi:hypothetical protein